VVEDAAMAEFEEEEKTTEDHVPAVTDDWIQNWPAFVE
jgi:hypothetical protein